MLARKILKVLAQEINENEKANIIAQLCKDEIYMQETSKNNKPAANRFKFIQKEFSKKGIHPAFRKVHRYERTGALVFTNSYILCTFNDEKFPAELIASEDEKLSYVDRTIDYCIRDAGDRNRNRICAEVKYSDVKEHLAVLPNKREKENDLIQVGESLFRTVLLEKIFKFYSTNSLVLYTKDKCVAYGYHDNNVYLIVPVIKDDLP